MAGVPYHRCLKQDNDFKRLDTFETDDQLRREVDSKASVAAIGRAGERLVRIAGVVADGRLGRVAARCGLGGVMGSKNLKAVVVRGTLNPDACDKVTLICLSSLLGVFG